MLRRTRVLMGVAVAGASSLALVAGTGSAFATTPKVHQSAKAVTFTGKISCSMTGTITSSPALKLTKTAKVTLTLKGSLSKCTGSTTQHKVTVESATVKGTSHGTESCTSLVTSGLPALSGTVTYKAKGGSVATTKVTFSAGTLTITSSPVAVAYPGSSGTAKTTGSFAGKTAALHGAVTQSESSLVASCTAGTMKTLTLGKGSTFKA